MSTIGLLEYAMKNQQPEPDPDPDQEDIRAAAQRYYDIQQERASVEDLKASISQQLEQGNDPEFILCTAIRAIGIATNDPEWMEAGLQAINEVYEDLEQQSFLVDNAAIAAERLKTKQAAYKDKLERQLISQLFAFHRLERMLQDTLEAVKALDPEEKQ